MSVQESVDVVIVGAGPSGLTASHLCRQLGVSCVVLEQREGPQRSPAAHAVNARSFEIWRQAGVDMTGILAATASPDDRPGRGQTRHRRSRRRNPWTEPAA